MRAVFGIVHLRCNRHSRWTLEMSSCVSGSWAPVWGQGWRERCVRPQYLGCTWSHRSGWGLLGRVCGIEMDGQHSGYEGENKVDQIPVPEGILKSWEWTIYHIDLSYCRIFQNFFSAYTIYSLRTDADSNLYPVEQQGKGPWSEHKRLPWVWSFTYQVEQKPGKNFGWRRMGREQNGYLMALNTNLAWTAVSF